MWMEVYECYNVWTEKRDAGINFVHFVSIHPVRFGIEEKNNKYSSFSFERVFGCRLKVNVEQPTLTMYRWESKFRRSFYIICKSTSIKVWSLTPRQPLLFPYLSTNLLLTVKVDVMKNLKIKYQLLTSRVLPL